MPTDRALEIANQINRDREEVEAAETLRTQPLFDRENEQASRARSLTVQQFVAEWRGWLDEDLISRDGFIYRVAMLGGLHTKMDSAGRVRPEDEADFVDFCDEAGASEVGDAWLFQRKGFGEMMREVGGTKTNGSFGYAKKPRVTEGGTVEGYAVALSFQLPGQNFLAETTHILDSDGYVPPSEKDFDG